MRHRWAFLLVTLGVTAVVMGQTTKPAEPVKLEPAERTFKGYMTEWAKAYEPKGEVMWEEFNRRRLGVNRELALYLPQAMPREVSLVVLADALGTVYTSPTCYVLKKEDGTSVIAPTSYFDKKELREKKSLPIKDLAALYHGGADEEQTFFWKLSTFVMGTRFLPLRAEFRDDSPDRHRMGVEGHSLEIEAPRYAIDQVEGLLALLRGKVKQWPARDEAGEKFAADAEKRFATPLRFTAAKMPLEQAIKKISDEAGINIVLWPGWALLKDAKITKEEPVLLSPGLPLNSLQGVVDQLKRKYEMVVAVKNGVVYIGPATNIYQMTRVTRVYDVRKHTAPNGRFDTQLGLEFEKGLKKNVSPGTWDEVDLGRVRELHGVLIVIHTEETHKRIVTLLRGR